MTLKRGETRCYDNLICANGTTWSPSRPELEGYLHLPAYRKAAGKLRKRLGWVALTPSPLEQRAWEGAH